MAGRESQSGERSEDARWMNRAIQLGRGGDPSPNPHVGSVVVSRGVLLAEARHETAGAAHAEQAALEKAGPSAAGATLYVTLEPCNHHGRTPPCTEAIVQAGITRVVVGCADPNPNVAGGGIDRLRAAGIEVVMDVSAEAARELVRPWTKYVTTQSSYLTLKLASSLDGRIATKTGASRWITSEAAREMAHQLRAEHDAVLVGVSTVVGDDPELTVRHGSHAPNPVRVIVDSSLRIPLTSKLVNTADEVPTCVVTTKTTPSKTADALTERGVNLVSVPANAQGRCDMRATLHALAEREVVSVLCEGGAELAGSLLADRLADELCVFVAPLLLGPRGRPSAMDWAGPSEPSTAPRVDAPVWQACGPDMLMRGPLVYPAKSADSR